MIGVSRILKNEKITPFLINRIQGVYRIVPKIVPKHSRFRDGVLGLGIT